MLNKNYIFKKKKQQQKTPTEVYMKYYVKNVKALSICYFQIITILICIYWLTGPKPRWPSLNHGVKVCYLGDADREGAGRQKAEEPHGWLGEISYKHSEKRQTPEHHCQHGAHCTCKLGLLKQRGQHEGEENLWD